MSQPGDVTVINTLSIQNNAPAPIVRSNDVLGGAQTVATIVALDAIPTYLRQEGMYAYVQATQQTYQLVGGILNANWVLVSAGSTTLQSAYTNGAAGGGSVLLTGSGGPLAITNPAATPQAGLTITQSTAGSNAITATGGDVNLSGGNFVTGATTLADGTLSRSAGAIAVSTTAGSVNLNAGGANSVVFNTNGANQWSVDSTGALLNLNGTPNNIGSATVAQRPANVYVGSTVVVGTTITINGVANTVVGSTGLALSTAAGAASLAGASTVTVSSGAGAASLTSTGGNVVLDSSGIVDLQIGGTSYWQVNGGGNLVASTDATSNIGASGANRPNNAYLANSVVVGAVATPATLSQASLTGAGPFTVQAIGAASDLTLNGRGAGTALNQSGQVSLNVAYTTASRNSVIGALNALVDGTIIPNAPGLPAVLAINNTTGAHDILVTAGQKVDSAMAGGSLNLGTVNATTSVNVGSSGNPISLAGNVTVGGNLTVNGTTTTINSTNLTVTDPLIYLNNGVTGPSFSGIAIDQGGTTTIAAPSGGQALPQAVINVVSTTGFPASGTILVTTTTGVQSVPYTSTTATTFVTDGVSGTGTMTNGGFISLSGAGSDKLLLWNSTNARFELGTFNTVGGTVVPASTLTSLSDLRVNNLTLAGTSITADATLALSTTGVGSDLSFTGRGTTTTLNQASQLGLNSAFTGAGFTSLVGALNSLVTGAVPATTTLQTAYNGGPAIIETALGPVTLTNSVGNTLDTLTVSKVGGSSGNGITVTVSGGASGLAAQFNGASISCPQNTTGERFGLGAQALGVQATAVGNNASANTAGVAVGNLASAGSGGSVSVGQNAQSTGSGIAIGGNSSATGSIAIGGATTAASSNSTAVGPAASIDGSSGNAAAFGTSSAISTSPNAVAIGPSSTAAGASNGTALGASAHVLAAGAMALGAGATTSVPNQLVIGSSATPITTAFIGSGVSNATPAALGVNGTASTGAAAGSTVTLAAGAGGTATGGQLLLVGGAGGSSDGTGGAVQLGGGSGGGTNGAGGLTSVVGGSSLGTGAAGSTTVSGGAAAGSGAGGSLALQGGTSSTGSGGDVSIQVGSMSVAQAVLVQAATGFTRFGSGAPTSTVHVNGSSAFKGVTITGATTADSTTTAYFANAATAAFAVTLPLAASCPDRQYIVKKIDTSANIVSILPSGSDLVDGVNFAGGGQQVAFAYESLTFQSDGGTNWWIV